MRALHACSVAIAGALLAGCGAEAGAPEVDGTAGAGGSDSSSIPDGTWVKSMTTEDARELGIPAALTRQLMGSDGQNFSELRIDGGDFAQFTEDGDAGRALGDTGSLEYGDDGTVVITSTSEGCSGCWHASRWTVDGDALTLEVLDFGDNAEDPVELLVGRLMMEGTFIRQ